METDDKSKEKKTGKKLTKKERLKKLKEAKKAKKAKLLEKKKAKLKEKKLKKGKAGKSKDSAAESDKSPKKKKKGKETDSDITSVEKTKLTTKKKGIKDKDIESDSESEENASPKKPKKGQIATASSPIKKKKGKVSEDKEEPKVLSKKKKLKASGETEESEGQGSPKKKKAKLAKEKADSPVKGKKGKRVDTETNEESEVEQNKETKKGKGKKDVTLVASPKKLGKQKEENKEDGMVFNDPIHGHIELHPLCVRIIDTPQFQRLRFLKQLGGCYFVYPGAAHNRFEHSLGVCHLAGQLGRALQQRQPDLGITSEDILCCEIAGLCHDLGHGPFSHLFDGKFIPLMDPESKWKHEDASVMMLDYLIKDNGLKDVFAQYCLGEQDITFIKEQVAGPNKVFANHNNGSEKIVWPYNGRSEKKSFLYELVANKRNGIDVDKWDYFARDCHMLGIRNNFDHTRFIQFARVLEVEGQLQICSRDKEVGNLYDMFHTRNTLHRRAYQHKTTKVIETMITEAMIMANNYIKFPGKDGVLKTMEQCAYDMEAFCQLTDHVFFQILHSTQPELEGARKILKNILRRKLYKCVGQTQLAASQVLKKEDLPEVKKEIEECLDKDEYECSPLESDDIIAHLVFFDYGMKDKNPIDSVRFYMKDRPNKPITIRRDQVSLLLPETFSEQQLRLYCKPDESRDESRSLEMWKTAFIDWCNKRGFPPPPEGGRVNSLELTPVTRSENGQTTPTTAGQSTSKDTTPDSAGKFKSRLSF